MHIRREEVVHLLVTGKICRLHRDEGQGPGADDQDGRIRHAQLGSMEAEGGACRRCEKGMEGGGVGW